jgi:cytochrome P450
MSQLTEQLSEQPEGQLQGSEQQADAPVRIKPGELADLLGLEKRLAKEHGGFARYRVLRRVLTVVADREANRHMFVRNRGAYRRGPQYDRLAQVIGRGLICTDGETWQRQRRLTQPVFSKALLARVADITATLAAETADGWEAAGERGEPVDVLDDMQNATMRVIGMALFSRDLKDEFGVAASNSFAATIRTGFQIIAPPGFSPVPLPLWFPTRLHRRFRRHRGIVDRFVSERIDERLADNAGYDDMLGNLIRSYGEHAAAARHELRDQVVNLFFAGFETTGVALAWTWMLLGSNPSVEARFHEELASVLGGRPPATGDLRSLAYTGQLIQESMRMYPPVYSLTREATDDDEIAGHNVRRGDDIVIPIHAVHHMEEYWDQPDTFCPERFAPGGLNHEQRGAYLPFAIGQHRCIGANFATVEMLTMLAVAGQRVRLRPAPGHSVTVVPAITQRPAGGLPMVVEKRS